MSNGKSTPSNHPTMAADVPPMDHFNGIQTAVAVIDSLRRVLFINFAAKRLLGYGETFQADGMTCHQLICGKETPCDGCLFQPSPSSAGHKSHTIQNKSGQELFLREELVRFPEYNTLLLLDVTREIAALKKLDLTRKELTAKAILLEQRRRVATDEKSRIQQMFDQLPDAFVHVNDELEIIQKNSSVSKILPHDSSVTCYGLLGSETPCPECPVQQGIQHAVGRKVTHQVEGHFLTEHIVQSSSEDGSFLLFRDTTRQIQLIEKIREQQDMITRKNAILSNLVGLQTRLQKASVTEEVINYFLDVFLPVCRTEEAIVIIDDIRAGCIWFAIHRGSGEPNLTRILRCYLSREVQNMASREIPEDLMPWKKARQLELIGGNEQKIGIILFPESDTDGEDDLTQLFTEPFGAFIHNQLLLRQLEEKANTDPLTGLYNRGYIENALAAEKAKCDELGMHFSVMVLDVNRLKQANDMHGHEAGDQLILTVSKKLESEIRATDLVARIGGDEFLILLPDTAEAGALHLVERFATEVFNNLTMAVGEKELFPVTVSIGVAGSDRVSYEALVKTADKRMYAAKETYYETHERYR